MSPTLDRAGRRAATRRSRTARALGAALVGALTAVALPAPPTAAAPAPAVAVVVRAADGALRDAVGAVEDLGGTVGRPLGIINGFAAEVPADRLDDLGRAEHVAAVTPDGTMRPLGEEDGDGSTTSEPTVDTGSMTHVNAIVGAPAMWERGYTGQGVDVAVIDTGVTPVPGLAGKVVDGPDLSFDAVEPAFQHLDGYGHGTHMAGIIAGRDGGPLDPADYVHAPGFVGVAPDARIVNVKVGAVDGATDVSQVIAAIDWVVQHRHDNGLNIRVLNLSFGTDTTQPYTVDPLAYAAEVAWHKGILVVAAGGNDGTTHPQLSNPAYNPWLLAVGASDPRATLGRQDDVVPDFASRSTTERNMDVIAPGVSVTSLRVPGSFIDSLADNAGQVGERFQRGSGTSQSAAVVSGVAALLAQRHPTATPDQLKALLARTAYDMPEEARPAEGAGIVDAAAAATAGLPDQETGELARSTGTGTLEGARGSLHVYDGDAVLQGEQDIFGVAWDGSRWSGDAWQEASWSGGTWNGSRWSGDGWSGSRWSSGEWSGSSWSGSRWSGSRWSGMGWDGSRWSGEGWNGSRWSGSRWSGSRWSDAGWS